jgi:hypothetical protein
MENEEWLVCEHCGRRYKRNDGDAERSDIFCCVACEYGY